jgi:hypothetical protein
LFHSPVRVPKGAGQGKAKVKLSFDAWKEGKVTSAAFEIPIVEPEPKAESEKK